VIVERITVGEATEDELEQHLERYRWVAGYTAPGETVLDVACGTAYARELFVPWASWIGVDKVEPVAEGQIQADLRVWQGWRDLSYDVVASFETIEHLEDSSNLVAMCKRARRWIAVSTPYIPSVHFNPYHVHDYSPADVVALFSDDVWRLQFYREQAESYGIFSFVRR
jgi:SAM-dependent methyltransferase